MSTVINEYQQRAQDTRSRRQARGLYKRPTQLQHDAYCKAMQSRRLYGEPVFDQEELEALASHPYLTQTQRAHYAAMLEG